MKILKATHNDLVEVLFLLKECVSDLNSNGLKHWNNAYPGADNMIKAIESETLYLLKEKGVAKGMVTLGMESPEEYKNIEWKTDSDKIIFIKFLAVHPRWENTDIAKKLIEFVEQYASDNNFSALRIDVYGGIEMAEKLFDDTGFNKTGQFHSSFQSTPYYAYEKGL